jgi:hypothetical protein
MSKMGHGRTEKSPAGIAASPSGQPQLRTSLGAPSNFRPCVMYGRRPRCKGNSTLPRMSGAVLYSAYWCGAVTESQSETHARKSHGTQRVLPINARQFRITVVITCN